MITTLNTSATHSARPSQHVATYLIDIAVPAEGGGGASVALLLLLPLHYTSTGDLTGCARRIQICPRARSASCAAHVSRLVRRPRVNLSARQVDAAEASAAREGGMGGGVCR